MRVLADKPTKNQINAVFPDDLYELVCRMAEALETPRSEVLRQLVEQAVVALRAAARAEDLGQDGGVAAVMAVQQRAIDGEVVRQHLDRLDDYLSEMVGRDERGAVQLARGSAVALQRWADQWGVTGSG